MAALTSRGVAAKLLPGTALVLAGHAGCGFHAHELGSRLRNVTLARGRSGSSSELRPSKTNVKLTSTEVTAEKADL